MRDASLSVFIEIFPYLFLQMPPRVPPQRIGCHRTSLDIKDAQVARP